MECDLLDCPEIEEIRGNQTMTTAKRSFNILLLPSGGAVETTTGTLRIGDGKEDLSARWGQTGRRRVLKRGLPGHAPSASVNFRSVAMHLLLFQSKNFTPHLCNDMKIFSDSLNRAVLGYGVQKKAEKSLHLVICHSGNAALGAFKKNVWTLFQLGTVQGVVVVGCLRPY
ncbi:hypothetical protein BDV40DRAFT_127000 [Aspergillus tamarii]|uniref:Uncharacterized protein n=1 Tax=Aspergillus tamarii TaxID=41984 RepID=A0A5N6UYU6_ASPTM|nr:hypothetical protein BDV40DRAFT_127000 [Aspergillus tamarii]